MRRLLIPAFACLAIAVAAAGGESPGLAQGAYPTRPIEMLVTWGPGGGADQTGRILGKLLEPRLKVSLPVDNIAGASGVTGLTKLIGGQAEGYQLAIVTADTYALLAGGTPQRWKLDDLAPIAVLIVQRSGILAKEGAFKSWADVEAKAKTTELKVAVTGLGTPDDMAVEALKKRGLKLISVPFAKPGERYAAVIGGHAELLYEQAGDVKSFIDGKQLAPLLFFSNAKVAPFESVATSKEIGLNLVLDQFRTVVTKAGTPPDRLKMLAAQVAEATKSPEYVKFLADQWADPASVRTGDGAQAYIRAEIELLKKMN